MINFIFRKPFAGQHSIEGCFGRVQEDLDKIGVENQKVVVPYESKGLLRRIAITLFVLKTSLSARTVTHITGDIYFSALLAKGPVVLTLHDVEMVNRASGLKKWMLRKLWVEWPCLRADVVTVVSNESKRNLLHLCPALSSEKVQVVPNSISDAFKPKPKQFPTNKFKILQVGTKPNKNVDRLILALRGLPCELIIVGRETGHLRRMLDDTGVIATFRENLNEREIVDAYGDADIVSLVSLEEGFGLPILEAQSVCRPVITSRVSSMPEVAGDGAFYADPLSVDSIREAIKSAAYDRELRSNTVMKGVVNAKRFQRQEIALEFLKIYKSLIGAH